MTAGGHDYNNPWGEDSPNVIYHVTLHAYSISSGSFKLMGRIGADIGDDGGGLTNYYPDRISFVGFDS